MLKYTPINYILYLLSRQDYSEKAIRTKMQKKGYLEEEISDAIENLKQKNLINDGRFADNFIKNKTEYGSCGKYKIKFKLEQSGIDSKMIDEKMAELDPDKEKDRALAAAKDWLERKRTVLPEKKYEKLGRFLISKGFEINTTREILENLKKEF